MKKAVFPGSFDPITIGHLDIVERAIKVFDEIIIAVGDNTNKKYMFPKEKRVEFVKQTFYNYDNVKIARGKAAVPSLEFWKVCRCFGVEEAAEKLELRKLLILNHSFRAS